MIPAVPDPSSFRDPSGHVYQLDGRIFRTVTNRAAEDYEFLRQSGFLSSLADRGWLIDSKEVDPAILGSAGVEARYVLEHPQLPFISYPYEWPFQVLKAAALFHLDLHLEALENNITLSDASAYNVQFKGTRPIFIDVLSLRRYRDGEFWLGHRQFCDQFLNPLLLRALLAVPHNAWYRGNLEGITTLELSRLLPVRRKLSWNVIIHVVLHARLQESAIRKRDSNIKAVNEKTLPRVAFRNMLVQLRRWVDGLEPGDRGKTVWRDYEINHTYAPDEESAKRKFVAEFVNKTKPKLLWDLGCNTGEYSAIALDAGAEYSIGFDSDHAALDTAFARAMAKGLNFLPLFVDATNPSPEQGWRQRERQGLQNRAKADAILALAFEHHLAIRRNVPLNELVSWITSLAPRGVIEFVQKDDPTIQQMLAFRDDIFREYSEYAFTAALERNARIVREETISSTRRRLFWYDRSKLQY